MKRHFCRLSRAQFGLKEIRSISVLFMAGADPPQPGDQLVVAPMFSKEGVVCEVCGLDMLPLQQAVSETTPSELGISREELLEGWDNIFPNFPVASNPIVAKVRFKATTETAELPISPAESICDIVAAAAWKEIATQEDQLVLSAIEEAMSPVLV